jgi:hypothetical protein
MSFAAAASFSCSGCDVMQRGNGKKVNHPRGMLMDLTNIHFPATAVVGPNSTLEPKNDHPKRPPNTTIKTIKPKTITPNDHRTMLPACCQSQTERQQHALAIALPVQEHLSTQ